MGKQRAVDLDGTLKLISRKSKAFDRFAARFLRRIHQVETPPADIDALYKEWRKEALTRRKAISDLWIKVYWAQWERNALAPKQWHDAGIRVDGPERTFNSFIGAIRKRVAFIRAVKALRSLPARKTRRRSTPRCPTKPRTPSSQ